MLTVPTTDGEAIEPFALRVAEAWKLGHQGADNGILLIVASKDRKARIEVGYGLEGVVPDAIAKRVIEDVMIPRFREGDMAGGIEAATDALDEGGARRSDSLRASDRSRDANRHDQRPARLRLLRVADRERAVAAVPRRQAAPRRRAARRR